MKFLNQQTKTKIISLVKKLIDYKETTTISDYLINSLHTESVKYEHTFNSSDAERLIENPELVKRLILEKFVDFVISKEHIHYVFVHDLETDNVTLRSHFSYLVSPTEYNSKPLKNKSFCGNCVNPKYGTTCKNSNCLRNKL